MTSTPPIESVAGEDFDGFVQSPALAVVGFTASWCGVCPQLKRTLAGVADEYPWLSVGVVDIDQAPETARTHSIQAAATVLLFKDGRKVASGVNPKPSQLRELLELHAA